VPAPAAKASNHSDPTFDWKVIDGKSTRIDGSSGLAGHGPIDMAPPYIKNR
jgi:hypothetical protein